MEQEQVSKLAKQFKRMSAEPALKALDKAIGFCKRERDITPYRLCLGLIEVFAAGKVEAIADIHRAFNARCGTRGGQARKIASCSFQPSSALKSPWTKLPTCGPDPAAKKLLRKTGAGY